MEWMMRFRPAGGATGRAAAGTVTCLLLAAVIAAAGPATAEPVPVLLVHGFNAGPDDWLPLVAAAQAEGLAYGGNLRVGQPDDFIVTELGTNVVYQRRYGITFYKGRLAGGEFSAAYRRPVADGYAEAEPELLAADLYTLSFSDNVDLSLADQAAELAAAVDAVRTVTGAERVALVGHSMGGLAIRCYLADVPDAPVAGVLFVAVPHWGSLLLHLPAHAGYVGPRSANWSQRAAQRFFGWLTGELAAHAATRLLRVDSEEIAALNRHRLPAGIRVIEVRAVYEPDPGTAEERLVARLRAEAEQAGAAELYRAALREEELAAVRARALAQYGPLDSDADRARADAGDGVVPLWSQVLPRECRPEPGAYEEAAVRRFHTRANEDAAVLLPLLRRVRGE